MTNAEKLKEVLASVLETEVSQITDETSVTTVSNWDSLRHMNLIVAVEEEFGFTVGDDDIQKLMSYKSLLDYIEKNAG